MENKVFINIYLWVSALGSFLLIGTSGCEDYLQLSRNMRGWISFNYVPVGLNKGKGNEGYKLQTNLFVRISATKGGIKLQGCEILLLFHWTRIYQKFSKFVWCGRFETTPNYLLRYAPLVTHSFQVGFYWSSNTSSCYCCY